MCYIVYLIKTGYCETALWSNIHVALLLILFQQEAARALKHPPRMALPPGEGEHNALSLSLLSIAPKSTQILSDPESTKKSISPSKSNHFFLWPSSTPPESSSNSVRNFLRCLHDDSWQGRIKGVSRVFGHPPFWFGCPFWKKTYSYSVKTYHRECIEPLFWGFKVVQGHRCW